MPIKAQCTCGKAFAAKDELAGKTVKCPSCQKPLKIPGGDPAAKSAAKPVAAAAKPAPAKPAPAKPAPAKPAASKAAQAASGDSLFDELGLAPPVDNTRPCPGCTQPMPLEAVVCVKCGYNTRMGRRMETEKEAKDGHVGHGAVAQDLLNKAADVIEGDAEAEKKKTKEGMPWWVYLIGLAILVGLATYMLNRGGSEEESKDKKGFVLPSGSSVPV